MRERPLLFPVVTAFAVLIALNLLIGAWSHRLAYVHKLEQIKAATTPNLLFVGNSLLDAHIDESALGQIEDQEGVHLIPVNAALGASAPPEHLLLFNYATQLHPSIRTVIIGFYDFQLTAPDHSTPADLTGNRLVAIDHRFSISEVFSVYGFDEFNRIEFEALRWLPMAANRANAWKYVELLRRWMGSMGMPRAATNSMGRVEDFSALESDSASEFDKMARSFLDHSNYFNASYEALFVHAQRAGINILIVAMPMSPYHRSMFYSRPLWPQYLAAVARGAAQRGIWFIDASDWMPSEEDFDDHLHMSSAAANIFTVRLGGEVAKQRF